jgi:hypothetical protein
MQTGIRTGLKDPHCTADDLHKDMVVQKFIKVLPQISDLCSWGAQSSENFSSSGLLKNFKQLAVTMKELAKNLRFRV